MIEHGQIARLVTQYWAIVRSVRRFYIVWTFKNVAFRFWYCCWVCCFFSFCWFCCCCCICCSFHWKFSYPRLKQDDPKCPAHGLLANYIDYYHLLKFTCVSTFENKFNKSMWFLSTLFCIYYGSFLFILFFSSIEQQQIYKFCQRISI